MMALRAENVIAEPFEIRNVCLDEFLTVNNCSMKSCCLNKCPESVSGLRQPIITLNVPEETVETLTDSVVTSCMMCHPDVLLIVLSLQQKDNMDTLLWRLFPDGLVMTLVDRCGVPNPIMSRECNCDVLDEGCQFSILQIETWPSTVELPLLPLQCACAPPAFVEPWSDTTSILPLGVNSWPDRQTRPHVLIEPVIDQHSFRKVCFESQYLTSVVVGRAVRRSSRSILMRPWPGTCSTHFAPFNVVYWRSSRRGPRLDLEFLQSDKTLAVMRPPHNWKTRKKDVLQEYYLSGLT